MTTQIELDAFKAAADALADGAVTLELLAAVDGSRAAVVSDAVMAVNPFLTADGGFDFTPNQGNVAKNGGITFGWNNVADGTGSFARGSFNRCTNGASCDGNYNTVDGPCAYAQGDHNDVIGFYACALGQSNVVRGKNRAIGRYCRAGPPALPGDTWQNIGSIDTTAVGTGVNVTGDNGCGGYGVNSSGDRADARGQHVDDRGIENYNVRGYGGINYLGDAAWPSAEAQGGELGLRQKTVGATGAVLSSEAGGDDGIRLRHNTLLSVPDNSVIQVSGMVSAFEPATRLSRCWEFRAKAVRGVGAASLIVQAVLVDVFPDVGTEDWALEIAADPAGFGGIAAIAYGAAGRTIHWVGRMFDVTSISA
jgi:hypothetical protein